MFCVGVMLKIYCDILVVGRCSVCGPISTGGAILCCAAPDVGFSLHINERYSGEDINWKTGCNLYSELWLFSLWLFILPILEMN